MGAMIMNIPDFKEAFAKNSDALMPVLFVGHGNPMNAIEDNEFSRQWETLGKEVPPPAAILCVSAHWQTKGTRINALEQPQTIHDFYGFPNELFAVKYPAKGSPDFARQTQQAITKTQPLLDYEWGLDHGCWIVLKRMFSGSGYTHFSTQSGY